MAFPPRPPAQPPTPGQAPPPVAAFIDDDPTTTPTTVRDLAAAYEFPQRDGEGHRVGIVLPGGGIDPTDPTFDTYAASLGVRRPEIKVVTVSGASNRFATYAQLAPMVKAAGGAYGPPSVQKIAPDHRPDDPLHPLHFLTTPKTLGGKATMQDAQWTGEGLMDLLLLMGLLPGATLYVYVCPYTVDGVAAAVDRAARDGLTALSLSFSFTEPDDTDALDEALARAAAARMTVCAASGNSGSSEDGSTTSVGFPASSPLVLACGGTMGTPGSEEVTWNEQMGPKRLASGGGFSAHYRRPPWQDDAHDDDMRGVPDVASNTSMSTGSWLWLQDPASPPHAPTGYNWTSFGTSSSAPVWAALSVRLSQVLHRKLGHLQPLLYQASVARAGFRDVDGGTNKATLTTHGYRAGDGWDPCTGLGRPDGVDLAAALRTALFNA